MLGVAVNATGPRWLLLFMHLNRPLVASNSAFSGKYPPAHDKTIKSGIKGLNFSLKSKENNQQELSEKKVRFNSFFFLTFVASKVISLE